MPFKSVVNGLKSVSRGDRVVAANSDLGLPVAGHHRNLEKQKTRPRQRPPWAFAFLSKGSSLAFGLCFFFVLAFVFLLKGSYKAIKAYF